MSPSACPFRGADNKKNICISILSSSLNNAATLAPMLSESPMEATWSPMDHRTCAKWHCISWFVFSRRVLRVLSLFSSLSSSVCSCSTLSRQTFFRLPFKVGMPTYERTQHGIPVVMNKGRTKDARRASRALVSLRTAPVYM